MHVIRHDDEVGHVVTLAIEVEQAVRDDPGQRRLPESAGTVAIVEMAMPALGKGTREFTTQASIQALEMLSPVPIARLDAVPAQPFLTLHMPTPQHVGRYRIDRTPGDEADSSGLPPVRQATLDDGVFRAGIEHLQRPKVRRHGPNCSPLAPREDSEPCLATRSVFDVARDHAAILSRSERSASRLCQRVPSF